MTENKMIDHLQKIWENMTTDKNQEVYKKMLCLLDNMVYYLRYDLGIEYSSEMPAMGEDTFDF